MRQHFPCKSEQRVKPVLVFSTVGSSRREGALPEQACGASLLGFLATPGSAARTSTKTSPGRLSGPVCLPRPSPSHRLRLQAGSGGWSLFHTGHSAVVPRCRLEPGSACWGLAGAGALTGRRLPVGRGVRGLPVRGGRLGLRVADIGGLSVGPVALLSVCLLQRRHKFNG